MAKSKESYNAKAKNEEETPQSEQDLEPTPAQKPAPPKKAKIPVPPMISVMQISNVPNMSIRVLPLGDGFIQIANGQFTPLGGMKHVKTVSDNGVKKYYLVNPK